MDDDVHARLQQDLRAASAPRGITGSPWLTWFSELLDQLESLDAFAESWLPG
jgi:hypothetical protein